MLSPSQIAENWWRSQGRTVPDKLTRQADWIKMYERWILYEWYPKSGLHKEVSTNRTVEPLPLLPNHQEGIMSLINGALKKQLVSGIGDIDLAIFSFKYQITHLPEEQAAPIYAKLVTANQAIIEAQSLINKL